MNSLYDVTTDARRSSEIIIDKMIAGRPSVEVKYRPFRIYDAISRNNWMNVDIKRIYPDAKKGDGVYVGMFLKASSDYDAGILIKGNVTVFVDGVEVTEKMEEPHEESAMNYFKVKKGMNKVDLLCTCDNDDEFKISFIPSTAHYPRMWAKDYLLYLGVFSPIDEFTCEECVGVSRLIKAGEKVDVSAAEYIWPKPDAEKKPLDLDKIFKQPEGNVCYALTYAKTETELLLKHNGNVTAKINGKLCESNTLKLNKGDEVLLKAVRKDGKFGTVEYEGDVEIPFVESKRCYGDKWLTIGTFATEGEAELKHGPENVIQFEYPYLDSCWNEIFWTFESDRDILRVYMDTYFYGQWFYPNMVAQYGILQAAKLLEYDKCLDYFNGSIGAMVKFFRYSLYEHRRYGYTTMQQRANELNHLDNIGTMGMNICEYYKMTGDVDALFCLKNLSEAMNRNIKRFDDGTFFRFGNEWVQQTMWADDMYMSMPLLVRLGHLFNDASFFDECVSQIKGFHKRLYRPKQGIYSHILYVDDGEPNEVSWSRGNGWIFASTADVLTKLPKKTKGYEDIVAIFTSFADHLREYQDKDGMWHQVIDHKDSYSETSGTTMFLYGMSLAIKIGILDAKKFGKCIKNAYTGLLKKMIDADGNVYGVCRGSGLSKDAEYYKQLASLTNDDHGTGIVLAAFAAYSEIEDML